LDRALAFTDSIDGDGLDYAHVFCGWLPHCKE
jgi:hypothetical protein